MNELQKWIENKKGYKAKLQSDLNTTTKSLQVCSSRLEICEEVLDFFTKIGKVTQDKIIHYFEDITSSMLRLVYGDEYSLKLSFVFRRDKNECDLAVYKGGVEVSLKDECGGGVVDIVSFAMRLAVWSLQSDKTMPIFILDEPFKYVSADKLTLVGRAISDLSKRLGLQVIMVSHSDELIEIADKAFRVTESNGVSEVITL
jgi:DNA repair exonuclease SbcCD ATPase subunit